MFKVACLSPSSKPSSASAAPSKEKVEQKQSSGSGSVTNTDLEAILGLVNISTDLVTGDENLTNDNDVGAAIAKEDGGDWKPPSDLPPTINQKDGRFISPPIDVTIAVESGLYGNLAPANQSNEQGGVLEDQSNSVTGVGNPAKESGDEELNVSVKAPVSNQKSKDAGVGKTVHFATATNSLSKDGRGTVRRVHFSTAIDSLGANKVDLRTAKKTNSVAGRDSSLIKDRETARRRDGLNTQKIKSPAANDGQSKDKGTVRKDPFPTASDSQNKDSQSKDITGTVRKVPFPTPSISPAHHPPQNNDDSSECSSLFSASDDENANEKAEEPQNKDESSECSSLFSDGDDENVDDDEKVEEQQRQGILTQANANANVNANANEQPHPEKDDEEGSDLESLFSHSDDDDQAEEAEQEEEQEPLASHEPPVEPQPLSTEDLLKMAPRFAEKSSKQPPPHDIQPLPKMRHDDDAVEGNNMDIQSNNQQQQQHVVFHPPTMDHAEESSESEGSTDEGSVFTLNENDKEENNNGVVGTRSATKQHGGLLGGILSKISTRGNKKKKKRDEASFGKVGYTIQKKKEATSCSSSSQYPDGSASKEVLIQNMISPPTQQKASSTSLQQEILAKVRRQKELALTHEDFEGMKEVARQSRERERERQQRQMISQDLSKSEQVEVEVEVQKKRSFSPERSKPLGKSARALKGTTTTVAALSLDRITVAASAYQAGSWKPQIGGNEQQGTIGARALSNPATSASAAMSAKEWNRNFALMKKYVKMHNHCDVPMGHSLQPWIQRQRNRCERWMHDAAENPHRDTMSVNNFKWHVQISKLERIGFDWGMAANKGRVRELLAVESRMLSRAQRESLDMKMGDNSKDGLPKKNKKKNARVRDSANRQKSMAAKKRKQAFSNGDTDDEEGEFELACRKGSLNRARASSVNSTNTVSNSSGEDDVSIAKLKKRPLSAMSKESSAMSLINDPTGDHDDDGYVDEQPNFMSWNEPSRKLTKKQKKSQSALCSMPAAKWVDLMMKFKESLSPETSTTNASEGCGKCWFNLEQAVKEKDTVQGRAPAPATALNVHQAPPLNNNGIIAMGNNSKPTTATNRSSSPVEMGKNIKQTFATTKSSSPVAIRKNIKQTSVATKTSSPMKLMARTPLKCPTPELVDGVTVLPEGTRVYAAWWKSKNKRSTPPYFYPGVVQSYKIIEKSTSLVYYDVNFDDGDQLTQINSSLVIPRKKYLKHNLKPMLKVGDEVYAAWGEGGNIGVADDEWYPGVIKARMERGYGGPYGPIRLYDVAFEDGDKLDAVPDSLVMHKNDYLLIMRKAVTGDKDFDDDYDGNGQLNEWIGVKNKVDKDCIVEDEWAREVGWYVATINGKDLLFSQLSVALRAYDTHTTRRLKASTQKSDLNLPEEWAFPSPLGICPPVHIGRSDAVRDNKEEEKQREQVYAGVVANDGNSANLDHTNFNNHKIDKVDDSISPSKDRVSSSTSTASVASAKAPNNEAANEGFWTCTCGEEMAPARSRCGQCSRWKGGTRKGAWGRKKQCCGVLLPPGKVQCGTCKKWRGSKLRRQVQKSSAADGDGIAVAEGHADSVGDGVGSAALEERAAAVNRVNEDHVDRELGSADDTKHSTIQSRQGYIDSFPPKQAATSMAPGATSSEDGTPFPDGKPIGQIEDDLGPSVSSKQTAASATNDGENQSPDLDSSSYIHGKGKGANSDTSELALPTVKGRKKETPNFNVIVNQQSKSGLAKKSDDKPKKLASITGGPPDITNPTETAPPNSSEEGTTPVASFSDTINSIKESSGLQKFPADGKCPLDLGDFAKQPATVPEGLAKNSSSDIAPCDAPTRTSNPPKFLSKNETILTSMPPQDLDNHSSSPSSKINVETSLAMDETATAKKPVPSRSFDGEAKHDTKCSDDEDKQPVLLALTPQESSPRHSSLSEKESSHPAVPAEGFPDGWTVRRVPRPPKKRSTVFADHFYYSPKECLKFRSKKEVSRFLERLKRVNGDELLAIEDRDNTAKICPFDKLDSVKCTETSNGNLATSALLGHSRSTTKAILSIIDLTNPETDSETLTTVDDDAEAPAVGTLTKTDEESYPLTQSEDFPNWTVRRVPRSNSEAARIDYKYYSPMKGYKFLSKPAVIRFIGCLERTNGNEKMAMKEYRLEFPSSAKKMSCNPSKANNLPVKKDFRTGSASVDALHGVVHYNAKYGIPNGNQTTSGTLGHTRSTTRGSVDLMDTTDPVNTTERPTKNPVNDTKSAATGSVKAKPKKVTSRSRIIHPTVSLRESAYPAMLAKGLPPDWTIRRIPRASTKSRAVDKLYYSPRGYRFRSKLEVNRFLDCLKQNRDEAVAIEEFHKILPKVRKRPISDVPSTKAQRKKGQKASPKQYKVVEYVEPSKTFLNRNSVREDDEKEANEGVAISNLTTASNENIKPLIKKGDKVYACWSGPDGRGEEWFPGRVWDVRELPTIGEYGLVKRYDVVFDDGDTESDMKEIWISKASEYDICVRKPDENEWIGVTNVRYPQSKDEYARMIGWYRTQFGDGLYRVYPSLGEALRAYDKHTVEIRGKGNVLAADLNFPEEHDIS